MKYKGNIIVAPLNWGLGHATRCIPIIHRLLNQDYNVILASDGAALNLLKREFPRLPSVEFPGYNINYPKKGQLLKFKLVYDSPRIIKSIINENKLTEHLVTKHDITAIISDNRYGVRHRDIPSIVISHQINVLSGNTSFISSSLNKFLLNKFDRCWVPDSLNKGNLSGELSRADLKIPIDYIGALSRFKKRELPIRIDVLIVLSGPSPHREILEKKMVEVFQNNESRIVMVKGNVEGSIQKELIKGIEVYNYLTSDKLEDFINSSKLVICRSGYSSIMDLASLSKRVYFIPTPGQFEQLYLAKRMEALKIAPFCYQEDFSLAYLEDLKNYNGFQKTPSSTEFESLFSFLQGK